MPSDARRWIARFTVIAIAIAVNAAAHAATVADLDRAQREYDRGVELKATKPAEARAAFAESAALFQHVVNAGADNAALHFNLGNAYVQSGDLGRGIASYLRARRLAPHDPVIGANLATARTDVMTKIAGDAVDDGSRIGWWRFVDESARLWTSIGLWLLFWGLVIWPLVVPTRAPRRSSLPVRALRGTALLGALLIGSTVAIDRWLVATRQLGVIVATDVVVRKGNGDGFEPQVAEKLTPGVECMVLEARPGWARVRLNDGTEGWVRESQLVPV